MGEHPSVNDELTEAVGHWGLFQTLVVLYDAVAFLAMGAHSTIYVLIAPNDAQHWCRRPSPSSPADVSDEEWRRANIPAQPDGSYAPCVRYEVLAPALSADGGYEDGAHLPRRTVPCDSWQFNGTRGAGSILEEVRERKHLQLLRAQL
ncbi:hypothetical protein HPB48_026468 [Haemaphysalis longicornis]|uniref:Uncharacterized protein n=1 Tax=Haemaphysalis longicornis TaxID=44386 RepID=A0A9J6HBY8_HAELO|nr:hypothetical protein HPB48_026468 [Haemaphysalis longicornis]